jgi:hypothetical protein
MKHWLLGKLRLGRLAVSWGFGSIGGGSPIVPKPGCMHLDLGDTAAMMIDFDPLAEMDLEVDSLAAMTITIEDC